MLHTHGTQNVFQLYHLSLKFQFRRKTAGVFFVLALILVTWRIWRASNNASR